MKRFVLFLSAAAILSPVAWSRTAETGPTSRPADKPASRPASRPTVTCTVATYNINYGNVNLNEVVKTIRKAKADLICLQETNRQSERRLRRAFRRQYRYVYFRPGRGAGGFGILSKSPLKNIRYLPPKHGCFGTLLFRTRLAGRQVQIANVHLHPTVPRGEETFGELAKLLSKTETIRAREIEYIHKSLIKTLPTILLGDFNSPPYMSVSGFLTQRGFVDAFAAVTPDAEKHVTWHWRRRGVEWKFRLDYIFHNRRLKTVSSRIIKSKASDHYLVSGTLAWAPRRTTRPAPTTQPKPKRQ